MKTLTASLQEAASEAHTPFKNRQKAFENWALGWENGEDGEAIDEIAAACGLSAQMVTWGIATTCAALRRDLSGLFEDSLGGRVASGRTLARPVGVCGHVWASTLPTSGWIPVVASLLLGCGVLIKAPRGVLPAAWHLAASIARAFPELAGAIRVAHWESGGPEDAEMVEACDALIVSGGAQAIARFGTLCAERTPEPIPMLGFGPGRSLAVVPLESLNTGSVLFEGLAMDVAAYDQLGCLSPQALWIETRDGEAFCAELASALDAVGGALPRGEVPASSAAAIVQRRGTAAFRGRVFEAKGAAVLWEPEPYRADCPLYRTIPVHAYEGGPKGLMKALGAGWGRLHAAAVAGDGATRARYGAALAPLKPSRICPPGRLQTPPADWHHDGLDWLSRLVHFIDLEDAQEATT